MLFEGKKIFALVKHSSNIIYRALNGWRHFFINAVRLV
ncbi:hypothetical protein vBEcoMWL3_gp092 [Escherichia phage vB_EcoM_WL-3]|nr:hypothetical protein vBEcoMWL3_gp092 [Escherichia phage vB_EcoM_WL-3]